MYGLTAALFAASALATPATSRDNWACTTKSSKVAMLQVRDFDFHASYTFTTPAHQNSGGYVHFSLANPAVDDKYNCSASSYQLQDFFYGNINYNCTDADGKSTDQARFTLSRQTETLTINQTWTCPDEGSRFWAEAEAKLDLHCKDTTWKNPNWKQGQIYSERTIRCEKLNQDMRPKALRAIA